MSDIEKFRKHVNEKVKVKLKAKDGTEDEFEFKPLNINQFTQMMILGERMSKVEQEGIDAEAAKEMMKLYVDIVKSSYPDLDDETAGSFVVAHFEDLSDLMLKLSPTNVDEKKLNTLKKIKELQKGTSEKDDQRQE